MGVDVLEVLVQAGRQALERRQVGIGLGHGLHLVGRVPHDRDVEVALAREVVVEQALRDPGGRRDVVDRDLVEGALAEDLDAQRDELLAAGVGAQAGATGGCHVDAHGSALAGLAPGLGEAQRPGQQRQPDGDHDAQDGVGGRRQPRGAATRLALQDEGVGAHRARTRARGNAGPVGLRRGRQVHRQAHEMRPLGQAQHRLPVAGHRHGALGDVPARRDLAQRGELAQLAGRAPLPGEDLEPLVVARRGGRIELDGDVDAPVAGGRRDDRRTRAVAAGARQREEERHECDGARQRDHARRDRRQARALALGHREALAQARAEDAAGQPGGQGQDDRGHEHRRGPRMGHPDVAPGPLGREADRSRCPAR